MLVLARKSKIAEISLTEIVVSDAVVPTDRVVLQTITLLSAVVILVRSYLVIAEAPAGALVPPGLLRGGEGLIELQV